MMKAALTLPVASPSNINLPSGASLVAALDRTLECYDRQHFLGTDRSKPITISELRDQIASFGRSLQAWPDLQAQVVAMTATAGDA